MSHADRFRACIETGDYTAAQKALADLSAEVEASARSLPANDPQILVLKRTAGDLLYWALQLVSSERAQCVEALGSLPQPGAYADPAGPAESWSLEA